MFDICFFSEGFFFFFFCWWNFSTTKYRVSRSLAGVTGTHVQVNEAHRVEGYGNPTSQVWRFLAASSSSFV